MNLEDKKVCIATQVFEFADRRRARICLHVFVRATLCFSFRDCQTHGKMLAQGSALMHICFWRPPFSKLRVAWVDCVHPYPPKLFGNGAAYQMNNGRSIRFCMGQHLVGDMSYKETYS